MHDFGALEAPAAPLAALQKQASGGICLNEDKTSKFAFRVHEMRGTEVTEVFVFALFFKHSLLVYTKRSLLSFVLASPKKPPYLKKQKYGGHLSFFV